MKRDNGFTLLEVLMVIAIMGILLAIALPNFGQYAVRAQRVEARNALQMIASQIDQHYRVTRNYKILSDKTSLSNDTIKNWKLDRIPVTGNKRYDISFVNGSITETGYIIQATAAGVQAQRDKDCPYFFYDQSGAKMASKTATPPAEGSRDPVSIACWSK